MPILEENIKTARRGAFHRLDQLRGKSERFVEFLILHNSFCYSSVSRAAFNQKEAGGMALLCVIWIYPYDGGRTPFR